MSLMGLIFLLILIVVLVLTSFLFRLRKRSKMFGYQGVFAYLRAIPVTDDQLQDAINLTLQGLVICLFALLIPLLVILGVFPLYYGARKLLSSWLGLGLTLNGGSDVSESTGA